MNVPTIATIAAPARAADSVQPSVAAEGFAALVGEQGQASGGKSAQAPAVPVAPKLATAADMLTQMEPAKGEVALDGEGNPSVQMPEVAPEASPTPELATTEPAAPGTPVVKPEAPLPIDSPVVTAEAPDAIAVAMAALPKPTIAKPADSLPVPAKGAKPGDKGKAAGKDDAISALATTGVDPSSIKPDQAPVATAMSAEQPKPVVAQGDVALAQAAIAQNPEVAPDQQNLGAELSDAIMAAGQAIARKATTAVTGDGTGGSEKAVPGDGKAIASADALHGTGSAVAADLPVAGRTVAFHEVYAAQKATTASDNSPIVAARTGTMGRDMGVEIARSVSAGKDQLVVRMDPPDMGRIDIRMTFDREGGLRAVVSADHQGTLDMMKREMGDLSRALSDAGVRADSQSFRFDTRGGDGGHQGQRGQQQASASGRQDNSDTENGDAIPDQQLAYRALRASGRVDMMA